MRTPPGLQALIDDGIIDAVLRPLKSGKEAAVYVVQRGDEVLCAKVYKDMAQRSFQARVQYQEGRKVRGSRAMRAMGKATKFGRKEQEAAWKNTEVDALYTLHDAGVSVPRPHGFFHGVLLMELVTDDEGYSAARLGEVVMDAEKAVLYHTELVRDIRSADYDLVMIGALGIGRVRDSEIGSVCDRVARTADSRPARLKRQ